MDIKTLSNCSSPDPPLCRTRSWSAPTSTMMTGTSPTAPSAVEAGKCSCAATTTAAGQWSTEHTVESGNGKLQFLLFVARTGFWISH